MKIKLLIKPEIQAKIRTNVLGSFLPGVNNNPTDRRGFSEKCVTEETRLARFRGGFKIGHKMNTKRPRIKVDKPKSKRTTLELKVVTEMREIQEACKGHALDVIKAFKEIVDNPVSTDQARISAGLALLDRAYGKSAQTNINTNVNANGKASEIDSKDLDKRVRDALKELRELQEEKAKRQRARTDLLTYASSIEIPGKPEDDDGSKDTFIPKLTSFGKHHLLWIDCLQKVENREIKRLMGLMPPGSAKSTYSSVVFPTHVMGRYPKTNIIVTSYGDELPRKFGRRARSIAKQPIFKRIFDCELSEDSAAANEWSLTNGSEWMAAGILTGITGNRADGVVWDDLIKGREQADSDIVRNKTWDAYMDDLLTRKKPNAWEVAVTTRWHEDDPAGRILPLSYNGESGWIKGRDGNDWYVVCIPAECEREDDVLGREIGEYIWPEWFPAGHFAPFKRNPRTWSALFQQRPAPESGDYFQAEWLKSYESDTSMPPRDTLRVYGASDYAVTKDGGDYTVHVVVGIDPNYNIYVLDLYRKQESSDRWIETFCDLVKKWRPIGWAEETGQINSGVGPFLHKRLMERHLYIARAQFPSRKDKSIRAQSIRGRMAMKGLYVPINEPWYPDLKNELMAFPNGRNDDQVDALSLIGQVLDKMMPGEGLRPEPSVPKVFSTDPNQCTVTMDDFWDAHDRKSKSRNLRIK